ARPVRPPPKTARNWCRCRRRWRPGGRADRAISPRVHPAVATWDQYPQVSPSAPMTAVLPVDGSAPRWRTAGGESLGGALLIGAPAGRDAWGEPENEDGEVVGVVVGAA